MSESHFEEDGSFTYTALVDICPPFELPGYKGLEVYKPPVEITEEQVQAELDKLAQSHAQLRAVEDARPIREGDVAIVDFTPISRGKVFEKGKTKDFMVEVGKRTFTPISTNTCWDTSPGRVSLLNWTILKTLRPRNWPAKGSVSI